MPEGHTVHRLADAFTAHFVGDVLHASSPQGRFTDGAGTIDGRRLLKAEAWGKQMFLLFEADLWLRVHLGMYGMWRFAGPGLAGIGRRMRRDARSYVAFRNGEPCRICATPIRMQIMAGRKLYWCPTCQTG